jgi:hypothetical protein
MLNNIEVSRTTGLLEQLREFLREVQQDFLLRSPLLAERASDLKLSVDREIERLRR